MDVLRAEDIFRETTHTTSTVTNTAIQILNEHIHAFDLDGDCFKDAEDELNEISAPTLEAAWSELEAAIETHALHNRSKRVSDSISELADQLCDECDRIRVLHASL